MKLAGGCLCQHIRYTIESPFIDAGFCHCRLCQSASGAPTTAWVTLPYSGFHYLNGTVNIFSSSPNYQREFCPHCGTQIAFRAQYQPKTIDVTLMSLDDSSQIKPEYHIWCESQVPWLSIHDHLPRYDDAGPDTL